MAMDQLNALLAAPQTGAAAEPATPGTARILLAHVAGGGGQLRLGEVLVRAAVITADQLERALARQQASPGKLLGTILIEGGDSTEEDIAQALGCQMGLPYICPNDETVDREALAFVPRDVCVWHVCIPMKVNDERIVVAMANPLDSEGLARMESLAGRRVAPVVAAPTDILSAIDSFYG